MIGTFYNRDDETRRLQRFLTTARGGLAVVYGRRRCGKSALLQRVLSAEHVYHQADQRETPLQLESLGSALSRRLPDFDKVKYRTWDELLASLYARADRLVHDSCCRMNHLSHRGSCVRPPTGGSSNGKGFSPPAGKTFVAQRFHGCNDSTSRSALHRPGRAACRPRSMSWRSRSTASRFCSASASGPTGTDGSTLPPSTVDCVNERNRSRSRRESASSRVAGWVVPHKRPDESTT